MPTLYETFSRRVAKTLIRSGGPGKCKANRKRRGYSQRLRHELLECRQLLDCHGIMGPLPNNECIALPEQADLDDSFRTFETIEQFTDSVLESAEKHFQQWRAPEELSDDILSWADSHPYNFEVVRFTDSNLLQPEFVVSDGRYVFVARDQTLTAIDVQDPTSLSIVSRTEVEENSKLFLHDDRLIVVTQNFGSFYAEPVTDTVEVFDISDPSSPSLLHSTDISGSIMVANMLDSHLVLTIQDNGWLPHPLQANDDGTPAESQESYLERVRDTAGDLMTNFRTVNADGELLREDAFADPLDVYVPLTMNDDLPFSTTALRTITRFDVSAEVPTFESAMVQGASFTRQIVTPTGAYMIGFDSMNGTSVTTIQRFAFTDSGIEPSGISTLDGSFLSMFNEHNGELRIATAITPSSPRRSTTIHVLDINSPTLESVGALRDIGRGESPPRFSLMRTEQSYRFGANNRRFLNWTFQIRRTLMSAPSLNLIANRFQFQSEMKCCCYLKVDSLRWTVIWRAPSHFLTFPTAPIRLRWIVLSAKTPSSKVGCHAMCNTLKKLAY